MRTWVAIFVAAWLSAPALGHADDPNGSDTNVAGTRTADDARKAATTHNDSMPKSESERINQKTPPTPLAEPYETPQPREVGRQGHAGANPVEPSPERP